MNIIQMSLDASTLLIGVMLIRLLFVNKLPKLTFLILWGIVALKLIIPYSLYSRLDFRPLLQNLLTNITTTEGSGNIQDAIQVSQTPNTLYNQFLLAIKSDFILSIWLIGVITVSLFFIVSYLRFYKEFQTAIPIINNSYLNEWLRDHKLMRHIQISVSDRITTPLTYKLFKPVIIFPKSTDWSDEKSIQFVLAHEYVHIKRMDVLWKGILTVILALHWFNPLVWVMYYLVNRDIELSCDEKVIRQFGDEAKSEYALSLINMAEKIKKVTPLCNNFSKDGVEERIVSIMKLKKTSILSIAFASTLVIGGLTVFASTGLASEENQAKANGSEEKNLSNEVLVNTSGEVVEISEQEGGIVISTETEKMQFNVDGKNLSNEPVLVSTSEGEIMASQNGESIIVEGEIMASQNGESIIVEDAETK
ncbi:M56 family metallopeptidase [Shouchella patagoniensis]|uniref:M56 family metallopeptidase n=1 Tax=Shouchella patagoniensis TaxID=228576 RepID=UPI0009952674|nr:M56 family metallopeptidase [Shouchella patagoniensis]